MAICWTLAKLWQFNSFWVTICIFITVCPKLSDHCLSVCPVLYVCLSVMLVYCGQTVRWIKMILGMEVGLRPDHIVLDGDPAPLPPKNGGKAPNFRPMSIVAKWLDGSRRHLVRRQALALAILC